MNHNPHTHIHLEEPDNSNSPELARYQQTKKVTVVGAIVNVILAATKIMCGYIGQSQALIADGIHSFSDLISDALVLFAAKHTSKEADEEHPYGHGRIETAVTVALGLILFAVAGGIIFDAIRRLLEPTALMHPSLIALIVAFSSVLSKEFLYHYTLRVANKYRSNLLRVNAWHHRSDAISSIIVIIGIMGTMMGVENLDAIAAIGVAFMIAKIGWDISFESIQELVDTAVPSEQIEIIKQTIVAVPGVKKLHMLRTRQMGGNALVDVHIQVDPKISVSEGHFVSEKVRSKLIRSIDDVTDVMVHIDSEDDEEIPLSVDLPARNVVVAELRLKWQSIAAVNSIKRINLHYLDGKIHIELILPLVEFNSKEEARAITQAFTDSAQEFEYVGSIQVLFG